MTYYILRTSEDDIQVLDIDPPDNKPNGGTKKILYKGENPPFELKHAGGLLENADGVFVFSPSLKEVNDKKLSSLNDNRPYATAKGLIIYLQNSIKQTNKRENKSLQQRAKEQFDLKSNLENWKSVINKELTKIDLWNLLINDTDNLTKEEFESFLKELNANKSINKDNRNIDALIKLANEWKETVKFGSI